MTVGRRVARSFATLAGGELAARALTFLVMVRLARVLGAEGFGALGFAAAVLTYLLLAPNLGLEIFGTREVAREAGNPTRVVELVEAALGLRLLAGLVAALLLAPIAALLPVSGEARLVVVLSGFSLLPYALSLRWLFLGLERPGVVAVGATAGQAAVLGAVLLLVRGRADLPRVPPIQAGGELLAALVLLAAAWRRLGPLRPRWRPREWRAILAQSLPIAAADATRAVVYSFDVLVLGLLLGEAAVGRYVAGYRLLLLVVTLGGFYYTALLPALTRTLRGRQLADAAPPLLPLAARGAALLAAPVAAGGIVLARPLLAAFFGAEYAVAAPAFRVLALSVLLTLVAGSCRHALIASGRQRVDARIVAAGAAVNVILNLALIPPLGLVGAALATLVAEGLILACGWRAVTRALGPLALGPSALVAGAGVAAMTLALLPLRAGPLPLSLATGALVYAIAVLALDRQLPGQLRALVARR